MRLETRLLHAGGEADPESGAVAPPIILSTTFARHPDGTPMGGHTYIRESNPTQDRVEEALAAAEGGEGAIVFAQANACLSGGSIPSGVSFPAETGASTSTTVSTNAREPDTA